jgi:parallel beta-helix repeat protein
MPTLYVRPPTNVYGTSVTYGSGDGSSEDNAFAGINACQASVQPGDTVVVGAGWYYEKVRLTVSGTEADPITYSFEDGAVIHESLNIAGNNTQGSDRLQGTGSSWAQVSGRPDIWYKGIGNYIYQLWKDGVRIPHNNPVFTSEADVVAGLKEGHWTLITKTTDGLGRTAYYRGEPSYWMRTNALQANSQANWGHAAFIIKDLSDIVIDGAEVVGYRPNWGQVSAILVDNCDRVTIKNSSVHDNQSGIRVTACRNCIVENCEAYYNDGQGMGIAGHTSLTPSGTVNLVTAVTKANPGVVTTAAAHGLQTGDIVVFDAVNGMTELTADGVAYTITYVSPTQFSLGVDTTTYTTFTNSGKIYHLKGTSSITIRDNYVHDNGILPRYNGIDLSWANDCDGIGVGYMGGDVHGLVIRDNVIERNGPSKAIESGEVSTLQRGSGIYLGTSYPMIVYEPKIIGNVFKDNHRFSCSMGDHMGCTIMNNIFMGTRHYMSASADSRSQLTIAPYADGNYTNIFANNVITGESGLGGLYCNTQYANQKFIVVNNIFTGIRGSVFGLLSSAFRYSSATGAANLTERNNVFWDIQDSKLYEAVSTEYSTIAAWQTATSKGQEDQLVDPQFVGGSAPTTKNGFMLRSGSSLCDAGFPFGRNLSPSIGAFDCNKLYRTDVTTTRNF